jgi:hypothetical protein
MTKRTYTPSLAKSGDEWKPKVPPTPFRKTGNDGNMEVKKWANPTANARRVKARNAKPV